MERRSLLPRATPAPPRHPTSGAGGLPNCSEVPSSRRFTVVIPLHRDNPKFRRCLAECQELDYEDFEILVVSDGDVNLPTGVRLLRTGSELDTSPAEKRDLAITETAGGFLAFIDDDAYPRQDWLRRALELFEDPTVGALGGPGLTPPQSRFGQRASGAFYESWLGSGPYRYRFRQGAGRDVDDYPAYNLVIRWEAAEAVAGWGTGFYGGEDTVICLELIRAGWRIAYDPELVVYHYRREIWGPHLRQIGNVGLHRGYFVKAYPETSLRLSYFLPTFGTAALALLMGASLVSATGRRLLAFGMGTYLVSGFALGLVEHDDAPVALLLPAVALASHVTYGVQFVRGLLHPKLER
jgi:Glycosyltransferase like family 2